MLGSCEERGGRRVAVGYLSRGSVGVPKYADHHHRQDRTSSVGGGLWMWMWMNGWLMVGWRDDAQIETDNGSQKSRSLLFVGS